MAPLRSGIGGGSFTWGKKDIRSAENEQNEKKKKKRRRMKKRKKWKEKYKSWKERMYVCENGKAELFSAIDVEVELEINSYAMLYRAIGL